MLINVTKTALKSKMLSAICTATACVICHTCAGTKFRPSNSKNTSFKQIRTHITSCLDFF